jgi:phosphatidylglycerol:prolipoprotein diacylglycerol transferase
MHPLLFTLSGHPVTSYSVMCALAVVVAALTVRYLARVYRLDEGPLHDLTFWGLVSGVVGARLLFVLVNWRTFAAAPSHIFQVSDGGFDFLGGPMLGLPVAFAIGRRRGLPWAASLDILFTSLAGAQVLGRLGCFLAGCCHGRPTDVAWGVRLHTDLVPPELRDVPLHPTQLYESGYMLLLYGGLLALAPRRRFDGQLVLTYFFAYPVGRFVIEFFRGDPVRGFFFGGLLSTSQVLSLVLVAGASAALVLRRPRIAP